MALNQRVKYVTFTINNPTAQILDGCKSYFDLKCDYMVIGQETGESGTPHLQGYMELTSRFTRMGAISKWFQENLGCSPHLEKRRGTAKQASDYCKKDDEDFLEYGELKESEQGKRTDIEKVRDMIKGGEIKSEWDLLNHVTSMSAYRFGSVFINNMPRPASRDPPIVLWLHGGTGTNKSRSSAEFVDILAERRGWGYWRANQGLAWFDGYNQQEVAWFDDFRFSGRQADYAMLLNITDRYALRVPIKGGFVGWNPRIIIFTGPTSIADTFAGLPEKDGVDQFQRRVKHEYDFNVDKGVGFRESILGFLGSADSQHLPVNEPGVKLFDPHGAEMSDDEESDCDSGVESIEMDSEEDDEEMEAAREALLTLSDDEIETNRFGKVVDLTGAGESKEN